MPQAKINYMKDRAAFDEEVKNMIICAHKAGMEASDLYLDQTNGGHAYCGFAWVKIPKGQRRFTEALKRLGEKYAPPQSQLFGSKDSNGGWSISIRDCRASYTQCMSTKEEYVRAFSYVVNNWEFADPEFKTQAYPQSRAD